MIMAVFVYNFLLMKCTILSLLLALAVATNFQTVAIIGTNDIHGTAFPTSLFRTDTSEAYNYGGLEFMAQMIETLQMEHEGNVLYLDAGDQFQGGIEASSLVSSGQIMNDFYNIIGVDASAIGNHEFDFGPSFLLPYMAGKDSSANLAANLRSEKGEENFLPLQKGEQLFSLKSGIKIGVIGLSTLETPSTTSAFNDGSFPAYQFLQYAPIVLERSARLKELGADAVLIVSHVGNDCNADNTYGVWDRYSEQSSQCSSDEITALLEALPVGTVDGVIQGHRHKFSHHFIRGVPVMGTNNGGYYFNVLYLHFYNRKIYEAEIEGPVPVCEKVFENARTCSYQRQEQLAVAGKLVPWKFHGRTVEKQADLQNIFETKWLPLMAEYLVPLVNNEVLLEKVVDRENDLGNLITNLMRAAVPQADFVITNSGGFRTTWIPGVLQEQHFYSMFPFTNTLNSFDMTGRELLDTLAIVQASVKGFYPTYGLAQTVTLDLSGNKKLRSATLYNGSAIEPDRVYRGVAITFLTQGGDDFKDVIGKVYSVRNEVLHGDFRTLIRPQLVKWGTIKAGTLVDPQRPRLTVVNV